MTKKNHPFQDGYSTGLVFICLLLYITEGLYTDLEKHSTSFRSSKPSAVYRPHLFLKYREPERLLAPARLQLLRTIEV